jgi:hypothetical protein
MPLSVLTGFTHSAICWFYNKSGKIKMLNYRKFLLGFITVSWIFLSGFNQPADNKSALEKQETTVEPAAATSLKPPKKPAKASAAHKIKSRAEPHDPIQYNALEKPLDLSIPFNDPDTDLKTGQKSTAQAGLTNIFAPPTKKKPRSLELDGDFLMSPEPEAEKRKSVDGAGIVIKLKP